MTAPVRRLALAGLGTALLGAAAALYVGAVRTDAGQERDIVLFAEAQGANAVLEGPASLLRGALPPVLVVVCAVLAVAAVVARRWRSLVAGTVIVAAATLGSRWLQTALDRPYLGEHGYTDNTFPSGHVAVTTALVVAVILLWPTSSRRAPLIVAPVVVAVTCLASVVGHAHRPSDVVGAVLLAGGLACLTTATCGPPAVRQER
ncbi:phosphatase PAP2 family protein [Isoptericola halotolerans]|uniref:phosphatase PAP2 family protein n=1 Tax=Isoptericola halotolerans TaxID=300560 RepID=UPI00388EEB41